MDVLIDGQRYVKEAQNKSTLIGIGITTHNRNTILSETVARIRSMTPNARIVIVDDASTVRVNIPDVEIYRFKRNVGIARAKNKCLELLSDCEHIFLFDDDTYPIQPYWYLPYIESAEPHLMYLFENWGNGKPVGDDSIVYKDDNIIAHEHARGCMIYVESRVLAIVGGMDVRYGKAMNEHLDWSNRIYNAGLTTFRYMDVPTGCDLIYSLDQHQSVVSSISRIERRMLHQNSLSLLNESLTSTKYAPYGKDVVIACYFSGIPDPQRGDKPWSVDFKPIERLKQSVEYHGYEFVLIHNCFDLPNKVTVSGSPYFERWLKEWQYLREHPEINNVFVVDATDVDMVNNPFPHIENDRLYVGDEPTETLANAWLQSNHPETIVNSYFKSNQDKDMLNCGVIGGNRALVMDICMNMYRYGIDNPTERTDMGIFNYLMHNNYFDKMVYGRKVTTLFKRFERRSTAWFRHK